MTKTLRLALLAGVALSAFAGPVFAAGTANAGNAAAQARYDALQKQIQDLSNQLQQVRQAQAQMAADAEAAPAPALADLKRSTSDQYADLNNQIAAQPKASIDNGRLQITSADGRFSAAVRGLFQFDSALYSQTKAASLLPAAYGPDFGSGSNFRRIYIGLSGKLFGDWTYNINTDFGGSGGTETPARAQSVYLEYDGLGPWAFRIGAYPAPASLEDGTSAGDTIFLERNAPSDLQRNIAGGDGRDSVSLLYTSPTIFGAISYTGNKIGDGAKAYAAAGATAVSNFDEQQATVGRLSWLPIATSDVKWLVGVNGTYVFKLPDLVSNGLPNAAGTVGAPVLSSITLSAPPELTVDSNGYTLANSTALSAKHVTQWGLESALEFENLYGQAGYYNIQVQRSPLAYTQFLTPTTTQASIVQPSADTFSAYYGQATWILTGESRGYSAATGAFTAPRPEHPLALDGSGFGALELALRYSDTNLNDHVVDPASLLTNWAGANQTYTYYNAARGGDQRIATLGLNWYPNSVIKFALNYQLIQTSRLQTTAVPAGLTSTTTTGIPSIPTVNGGQNVQAISLRAQLSL